MNGWPRKALWAIGENRIPPGLHLFPSTTPIATSSGLPSDSPPRLDNFPTFNPAITSVTRRCRSLNLHFKVGSISVRQPSKWMGIVCAVVCVHILVTLLASHSIGLTAFGDLLQCALLFAGTLSIFSNIKTTDKKAQLFWSLWLWAAECGSAFKFCGPTLKSSFAKRCQSVRRGCRFIPACRAYDGRVSGATSHSAEMIILSGWQVSIFFYCSRGGSYLYLFIVIPWQYVSPNEAIYGRSFDLLYACEQVVLVIGVGLAWRNSRGSWRIIYSQFFKATLLYSVSSILAGVAIDVHRYYTGSLYDVPLVAAMAWFATIGLMARGLSTDASSDQQPPPGHSMWTARLAMLAVFSTPLMVVWAEFGGHAPQRVRSYRLLVDRSSDGFNGRAGVRQAALDGPQAAPLAAPVSPES